MIIIIGVIIKNGNINNEIINIIYKYDFIPVIINVNTNQSISSIMPLLKLCNGFILQGGKYIYDIDYEIVKYLYNENIPTLGICLGMQTMALAFNGEEMLINNHNNKDKYVHNININSNSKLYSIIKKDNILVNSRHNYCIKYTNLSISSMSNIIESVEDKYKNFFIGVQWHPESIDDENSQLLFNSFFNSIK